MKNSLGSALGGLMGPLGALAGSALGGLVDNLFGSKGRDAVKDFAGSMGGFGNNMDAFTAMRG